jgi:murein DD-endopeptidase MepM/ murein hydrolase activator NlpD
MDRLIMVALQLALADGFDFPVGYGDARGYYDAQPFGGDRAHLGNDWNGVRGGDSDLGDPVLAVAGGRVVDASDYEGGWGNVVRVVHRVREADGRERVIESLYAHLERIDVRLGQFVERGEPIGTIGTAGGVYRAHLHLEIRTVPGRPLGLGYGPPDAQVDPTAYIRARRPPRERHAQRQSRVSPRTSP